MTFLFRTFARPVIGLTTLAIILITYYGGVRFKGGIPGGLVAVAVGTGLAWLTGVSPPADSTVGTALGWMTGVSTPADSVIEPKLHLPVPVIGDLMSALTSPHWKMYVAIIIPMGLFNLIGSLQNIESAEAAGDSYPVLPSLAVNGMGSMVAAVFGSCFPTTIYIGHPGWKALGARAGYSVLNAIFFTIVCLTGVLGWITYAVPIDAGMAIVLYIGIVITAQAFQATPREHAPAVVIGLLPGVAAWGTLMAKQALQVSGYGGPKGPDFNSNLVPLFQERDIWIDGAFALSEGFIFTSMILAAATVAIIEKKFRAAALWCLAAAGLSAIGLMHSFRYTPGDTALALGTPLWTSDGHPANWNWVKGYALMALLLFIAPVVTEKGEGH
jgi:AGZA family xanthine/uracil permease-like MFS transporter